MQGFADFVRENFTLPERRSSVAESSLVQPAPLSIFGVTRDKQRVLNKIRAKKDRPAKQTPFTATADKVICKSTEQRGDFELLVDGVLCRGVHFFTASPRYPGQGTFFPVALFAPKSRARIRPSRSPVECTVTLMLAGNLSMM